MSSEREYEERLSAAQARIAELMTENVELVKLNWHLSDILRSAAIAVAEEGLLERP